MTTMPDPGKEEPTPPTVILATGGSVAAGWVGHLEVHLPPPPGVSWPVQVGQVPQAASAFQSRQGLREAVDRARANGAGVVLTQVLSGGGGVGKSQLAASYARQAATDGGDLVVWADATRPDGVIEAFARAARAIRAPGTDGIDAEADARSFLEWAAVTSRSWLVVLDDIANPAQIARWWPASQSRTGWVLATTRRRDAALSGSGRVLIEVSVFTADEAEAYLTDRLSTVRLAHLLDRSEDLAAELGYLPLALSHAAAYMIDQQITCSAYLDRYAAGQDRLENLLPASGDGDGYGRPAAVTLLLALDAADQCEPKGLAQPAVTLAALLDPAGHPARLWATDTVTGYLASQRSQAYQMVGREQEKTTPAPVTAEQARATVLILHRYGLVSFDEQAEPRALRMHALTGRAAWEAASTSRAAAAVRTAADALESIWPDPDQTAPELAEALRASTATMADYAGDALWQQGAHPVVIQAGTSLLRAGLHAAATAYWQQATANSRRILGPDHVDTLTSCADLAVSYQHAGRTSDAITLGEQVTAERERILGPDHADTLTARANLALAYQQAGRMNEAIPILEQIAAIREQILGPDDPATLTTRANLAVCYRQAGRTADAVAIGEQVAAAREQLLGRDHPATLTARNNLAAAYRQAGRFADAITVSKQVAAIREQILGPDHPATLTALANLASSYQRDGRTADAIAIKEQVAAATERVLGPDHFDTLTARNNLAVSYQRAGRIADAIAIGEQVAAARERILGPDHPDTLGARVDLAASYRKAGRTEDAINMSEQVAAKSQRILGPDHPSTFTARANLASSYLQVGRIAEAITIAQQVAADRERVLGPDHPETINARETARHWIAKRTSRMLRPRRTRKPG